MRRLDYAAIREQIPIRRVLELLHWEPVRRCGLQWRGRCPLLCSPSSATESKPNFSVHISRHLFHCFHCQRSGNQLDLWADATGLPLYPATLDLCRHLGLPPIRLKNTQPPNLQ